jgi:hypothetical protein
MSRGGNNLVDRTGKRYGRLVVIGRHGSIGKTTLWDCLCDCGKQTVVRADHLRSGDTESCGCKRQSPHQGYRCHLLPGVAAQRTIVKNYRLSAKYRGLLMELTDQDVFALIAMPCFYCGSPPERIRKVSRNGSVSFNGIDRIDNSQGYTIDNTVPCCHTCNHAKCNMSQADFIAWIKRAAANLQNS